MAEQGTFNPKVVGSSPTGCTIFTKGILTAKFTKEQREKLANQDKALPDGSCLIRNRADLDNAIQATGRSDDYDRTKRWIIKRAGQLKLKDILPEKWNV